MVVYMINNNILYLKMRLIARKRDGFRVINYVKNRIHLHNILARSLRPHVRVWL